MTSQIILSPCIVARGQEEYKEESMTVDEKVEAYRMRLEGASFNEIGRHFGVSKQYIQQILPVPEKNRVEMSADSCVYKNISKWMLQNGISYSKLAKYSGITQSGVQRFLTGKCSANKTTIDKLLDVLQMSYEEAFATK